jgi:hypothetical protein
VAAVTAYLTDRAGLPPAAVTPAEVEAHLTGHPAQGRLVGPTVAFLRRCDAARFAPAAGDATDLAADARRLIVDWEAQV